LALPLLDCSSDNVAILTFELTKEALVANLTKLGCNDLFGSTSGDATKVVWGSFGFARLIAFFVEDGSEDKNVAGFLVEVSAGLIGVTNTSVVSGQYGGLDDFNKLLERNLVLALNVFQNT
jgi:hypothetical protein